jgi:hypothetical protein
VTEVDAADFPQPGDEQPGAPPALRRTPRESSARVDKVSIAPAATGAVPTGGSSAAATPEPRYVAAAPPVGFATRLLRSPGVLAGVVFGAAAAGIGLAGYGGRCVR